MAKKRSGARTGNRSRIAGGNGRNTVRSVSGMWRLSLIVFAIVCFRVLELMDIRSLEFVRRIRDAWGVADYNLNFILLGISLAGTIILMCSKASKDALNLTGGMMMLIPVWFRCDDFTGAIGARAMSLNGLDPLAIAFAAGACTLCICMLHGADKKLQLFIGALMIAENAGLCLLSDFPVDWWQLVTINAFAIGAGLAMDLAYNGFNPSTLFPVAAITAEFMLRYADTGTEKTAYITAGLCAVCLLITAASPRLRKGSSGIAVSLVSVAVNAMTILYLNSSSLL